MRLSTLFWDFNGTLLNDSAAALAAVNDMLAARGAEAIDFRTYSAAVETPVLRFYKKFDALRGIAAEQVFREFGQGYLRHSGQITLAQGALQTLEEMERAGVRQIILSSFEQGGVERWLQHFGISRYFSAVCAAGDNRAESKEGRGTAWLRQSGLDPRECLLVGDTVHDAQVSRAMGVKCLLVAGGHQLREHLEGHGASVIGTLGELIAFAQQL